MRRNFNQQFQQMQSPKILINQSKNFQGPHTNINQRGGVLKRHKNSDQSATNSKSSMISQLQQILKELADVSKIQIEQKGSQLKDTILDQLHSLEKKAQINGFREIEKLCMLAIGKRILNIQLKKKRQEFIKKQQKKSQIQQFFRENRIKKFNYQQLIQQKLLQNTLIVRPYGSGKGFIGSGLDYRNYQSVLLECDYVNVIRQINKIFFYIFSGKNKDQKDKVNDLLFKILWIPTIIFLIFLISIPFYSFPYQEYLLTSLLVIIIITLGFVAISIYLNVPNSNNQIQQSIQDTKKYFKKINQKNFQKGKEYEWNCPDNFMYLEVKFKHPILEG